MKKNTHYCAKRTTSSINRPTSNIKILPPSHVKKSIIPEGLTRPQADGGA